VGVTDLSASIAIDCPLLPTIGRDRSVSFAIDQKDLPIHRKTFHHRSSSIERSNDQTADGSRLGSFNYNHDLRGRRLRN
jgi:hypothetical protein